MQATKLKGTLAEIRDLPEYPHQVVKSIAIFNVVLAVLQGLIGLALLTQLDAILNIFGVLGFLSNSMFDTNISISAIRSAAPILSANGLFLVIQAGMRLYVAFGITSEWPNMWLATTAVSVWSFYNWLQLPEGILTYIALLITGVFSVLLIFDKRVQAYFKVGPLTERYWSWLYDRQRGKPVPATPWEYEARPSTPL